MLRPHSREADEKGVVPADVITRGWELGLVQSAIPEALGGYGDPRSAITGALLLEELAYGDLSLALHLVTPRLFTDAVARGRHARAAAALAAGASPGDTFTAGTAAFAEPRWDFDPTALGTRAERAGGDWVLTGTKCLVPLAADAEVMLVYATAPDGPGRVRRRTWRAGLTIGERERNMGIKALATHGVDAGRRPGAGGEPPRRRRRASLQPLIDACRVAVAALAVGVARAAFDYAREYAKERTAFGVAIAQKQAIAFMLADMAIEIDAMRLLCLGGRLAHRRGRARHARGVPGPPVRRQRVAQDHRQRRAGARRPRLHPRPSGRALAAQRPRLRDLRRPRHRLN